MWFYIYFLLLAIVGQIMLLTELRTGGNLVLAVLGGALVVCGLAGLLLVWRMQKRIIRIHALVDCGRLDDAIREMDALDDRFIGVLRGPVSFLRFSPPAIAASKAGLLWAKGDFEEAHRILEGLRYETLPVTARPVYVLNRFSCLTSLERLDEAKEHYLKHRELIENPTAKGQTPVTHLGSRSAYAFYFGDLEESRRLTLEALEHNPGPLNRAFYHLRLGRIDLQQGDRAAAEEHFVEAARLGIGTFIPDKIKALTDSGTS